MKIDQCPRINNTGHNYRSRKYNANFSIIDYITKPKWAKWFDKMAKFSNLFKNQNQNQTLVSSEIGKHTHRHTHRENESIFKEKIFKNFIIKLTCS